LAAVLVDHLAEVALLAEKPDADHRNAQVAGGLELIASDINEPARVDGQRLAEHELHAEVRDAGEGRLGMFLLEPGGRGHPLTPSFRQSVHILAERRIGQ